MLFYTNQWFHVVTIDKLTKFSAVPSCNYRSVPGKRPWALKHKSLFWPAWTLTQDIFSIRLYRSCYIDLLKCSTWALTQEWALAQDTVVIFNLVDVAKKARVIIASYLYPDIPSKCYGYIVSETIVWILKRVIIHLCICMCARMNYVEGMLYVHVAS